MRTTPRVPRFEVPHWGVPRWGDRRATRIGLLGGSFNPAHAGHLQVAETALRRLRLDQVWLLVSPGNPLKQAAGMAPLGVRLAGAAALAARAGGGRVVATDIERHLRTRYTADTLRALHRRFPRVRFVWLMGADNLAQLPRWRRWMDIVRAVPIAVLPRPGYNERALAGLAARRMRRWRVPGGVVANHPAPAWAFLNARQNALSATAVRRATGGR